MRYLVPSTNNKLPDSIIGSTNGFGPLNSSSNLLPVTK